MYHGLCLLLEKMQESCVGCYLNKGKNNIHAIVNCGADSNCNKHSEKGEVSVGYE